MLFLINNHLCLNLSRFSACWGFADHAELFSIMLPVLSRLLEVCCSMLAVSWFLDLEKHVWTLSTLHDPCQKCTSFCILFMWFALVLAELCLFFQGF